MSAAQAIDIRNEASVEVFRAPLFERILKAEESDARQVVLDLGSPCQALIGRLAAIRPTRFEVADLVARGEFEELRQLGPADDTEQPDLRRFLPPGCQEPLNLIFCWDLPNYLKLGTFASLCELFAERAAPGCQLHMLVAYSRRDMPANPAHFAVRDDGQLTQTIANNSTVAAPRYSPEALGDAVGGFRYERGVLLANGNQEFVYAWPR
jgi:hypothetical protein